MLGDADLSGYTARRLGEDGLVRRTAAASDAAAATVEQAHTDIVFFEEFDQAQFRLIETPRAGHVAAVFVGIGIAEHDFLNVVAALQQVAVPFVAEHGFHDGAGVFEGFDGFEEGDDVDAALRFAVFNRQQAAFFEQQREGEQVAGLFAVGDDALGNGVLAEFVFDVARFVENRHFAAGVFAVSDERAGQRPLVFQLAQQDGLFFRFGKAAVVFQTGVFEEFGDDIGVFFRVLAQVERHHVEAEHGHGTDQVGEPAFAQKRAAVVAQGALQLVEVV